MATSRRTFLLGAAGASLAATGCSSVAAQRAEELGAFTSLPGGSELLGPQAGVARLNNNENPYGPAASALRMADYANRKGAYYAMGATPVLTKMIARSHGVSPEQVTLSTGSAEALSAIAMVYGRRGPIVAPRLFFDATVMYAKRLGLAEVKRAPMQSDMSIDLAAIEALVNGDTGFVSLCNPNNPTGLLTDAATLKPVVKRMAGKTLVVVDEAYMELTDDPVANSCVDLVKAGHNVVVSRTFSKLYGMAGLRVGYTLSQPEVAKTIRGANMTWMSGVGLAAAIGCFEDSAFVERSRRKILEARQMTADALQKLGVEVLPSAANFVYFKSGITANRLQEALAAQNIQIRGQYMDYDAWSRVSMGKLEDVARFCKVLPRVLNA